MLKFLVILLIVIYFWSILRNAAKFVKITSCIDSLCDFLKSTSPASYSHSLTGNSYREKLNAVLAKYPDICEFKSYYSDSLGYGASDYSNSLSSVNLYNDLLMQRNFLRKDIISCLNPISALKIMISLPSSILKQLGFKTKPAIAKLLNLFGWIIAYLLSMYTEELKALINSLLRLH